MPETSTRCFAASKSTIQLQSVSSHILPLFRSVSGCISFNPFFSQYMKLWAPFWKGHTDEATLQECEFFTTFFPYCRWKADRCRKHILTVSSSCHQWSWQVSSFFKCLSDFIETMIVSSTWTLNHYVSSNSEKHMFAHTCLWVQTKRNLPYISSFYNPYPLLLFSFLHPSTA